MAIAISLALVLAFLSVGFNKLSTGTINFSAKSVLFLYNYLAIKATGEMPTNDHNI